MTLYVQAMTENCPKIESGEHNFTGHGDPKYMWCMFCQQEKPSNKEFIAYELDENHLVTARTVVDAKRLIWTLESIKTGEQVHLVKPLDA